eukprot:CAMPEP_0198212166 /NCGR_PEP_ID=MMETSP1445-20131203/25559_1 /TAXON_ID=36898 /ORGANISM="Pyramimonas sp., Strain CCMP2087" /LENGTH=174 /DNA_ID=CAMNT_0043886555 /DNA_START=183 /DNA_END=703 /DNA_ORIENTATION=-
MTLSWLLSRGVCGGQRQVASREYDSSCVFCRVGSGEEEPANSKAVLHKNDRMVAFHDRSPAADVHILVCSVAHIESAKDLKRGEEDFKLVSDMLDLGKTLIAELAPQDETQYGFHLPPFNSVDHLHLHCFALPFRPAWKAWKYKQLPTPLGTTYLTASELLKELRPEPSVSETA